MHHTSREHTFVQYVNITMANDWSVLEVIHSLTLGQSLQRLRSVPLKVMWV